VDGYVKVINAVVCFCFCCELQAGVHRVEILEDCLYVGVAGVICYQDVVYVSPVVYDFVFVC